MDKRSKPNPRTESPLVEDHSEFIEGRGNRRSDFAVHFDHSSRGMPFYRGAFVDTDVVL